MKAFTILLFACSLAASTYAQDTYKLTGELTADSRKAVKQLFITYEDELGNTVKLDSAQVKRGKFTFEGTIPAHVEKVSLSGFPREILSFFLDPGELTVTGLDAQAPAKARVTGSHNNDIYNKVKDLEAQSLQAAAEKVKAYEASLPADIKNDPAQLKKYVAAESERQQALARLDVMDFIASNLYEPIAVWLVNDYCRDYFSPYTMQRDILVALPASCQNHPLYQEMVSFALSSDLKSGVDAPVIVGRDLDGKRLSSADLKGKYVLVHFWSSQDPASTAETAKLKEALEAARDFGRFAVLSYSLDTDARAWADAVTRLGMTDPNWHHASALKGMDSKPARLYQFKKLPFSVLLNPQGKIIEMELRGDNIVSKVTRIAEGIETYE